MRKAMLFATTTAAILFSQAVAAQSAIDLEDKALEERVVEQIVERCRAVAGNMGANIVKVCVDQDIKAVNALDRYSDDASPFIERCINRAGSMGWNIVKICVDQDIAAEEALSKY